MSHARTIATGSGKLAVRVTVEGLDTEFVSDPDMETTTADGRARVLCLPPMGQGIIFEEKTNIPEATLEVSQMRFTVYETDDQALSQLFMPMKSPTISTWLTATIDDNDVSIPVMGTNGVTNSSVVHIGTETILLANPAVSGSNLLVQTRGYRDTTAQYHYSADSSAGGQYAVLTSEPLRLRGRRVRVYLYGEGDTATGDGTLRWIGKVTSDPMLSSDGLEWSFSADHVWSAVRTKIGSELATPMAPRGIYYSWAAPLHIEVREIAASALEEDTTLVGFYETQDDFIQALNALLATDLTAPLVSTYTAILDPADPSTWTIAVTAGAAVTNITITIRSEQDGFLPGGTGAWLDSDGAETTAFTSGQTYTLAWVTTDSGVGQRTVPRGYFGRSTRFAPWADPDQRLAFPEYRIYTDRPVSSDWSGVLIDAPIGAVSARVSVLNTTYNYFDCGTTIPVDPWGYNAAANVELRPGRALASGNVASLRDGIVADAARYANRGTAAWLTAGDLASWTDVAAQAARGRSFLSQRSYMTFDALDLDELLQAEFRLCNLFPYLDSQGKVAIRQWSIPSATAANLTEIDDEIISETRATLEPDAHGTINTVVLKRGYDPIEGEHTGATITVIDVASYTLDHETRPLEVAPKSRATEGDTAITAEDAAEIFQPVLGYFGQPYMSVKIAVSWKLSALLLGDPVLVNSEHLPAFTGLRPMADVVGVVVGRRWALGDAYGTLTVLVSPQNIAGYAPSARFTGTNATNVSGNIWDIVITTGLYAPTGYTEDQFFAAADKVQVITYDAESPTRLAGTIVSVTTASHTIRVTFGGAFTPGTGKWLLLFDTYSAVTATQHDYCYISADDGRIGSAENARTFAP